MKRPTKASTPMTNSVRSSTPDPPERAIDLAVELVVLVHPEIHDRACDQSSSAISLRPYGRYWTFAILPSRSSVNIYG